jgi:hypothetical protein
MLQLPEVKEGLEAAWGLYLTLMAGGEKKGEWDMPPSYSCLQ